MKHSNIEHEQIVFGVEYHFVAEPNSEHGGIVEGYGATFGHPLESGVIVDRGAFKKTIPERIKRAGGSMVPYLDSHQWDIAHTIGTVIDGSEDSKGFAFKSQLSKAPSAQDTLIKMREGHIKLNSIGFMPIQEGYQTESADGRTIKRRHIREVKLFELSALPLANDEQAAIVRVHGMVPYQDLPLAPRDIQWDSKNGDALGRVIAWAAGATTFLISPPQHDINWAKFRRAFLSFDPEKPDEITSYKFQIADVVDGELMALPSAVIAHASERLLTGDEKQNLERYFEKMAAEFGDESLVPPWKKSSIDSLLLETKRIGVYDMGDIRKAANEFFSVLTPEDRSKLLAELSAGPALKPPTEGTRDSGALEEARAKLGTRLTQLSSTVSELTRRRGQ